MSCCNIIVGRIKYLTVELQYRKRYELLQLKKDIQFLFNNVLQYRKRYELLQQGYDFGDQELIAEVVTIPQAV